MCSVWAVDVSTLGRRQMLALSRPLVPTRDLLVPPACGIVVFSVRSLALDRVVKRSACDE